MRKSLDRLYLWSGYVSAAFLVAIAATIVGQIVGRFFGVAVDSTESAGFCLAGSTFFGLAYTYREGAHIRVTLLTRLAKGAVRRVMNIWAVAAFALVSGYLAYWSFDLVYFSHKFGDISPGLLAIPFWIPRLAMALGATVLTVALLDELAALLRGAPATYDPAELKEAAAGRGGTAAAEAAEEPV